MPTPEQIARWKKFPIMHLSPEEQAQRETYYASPEFKQLQQGREASQRPEYPAEVRVNRAVHGSNWQPGIDPLTGREFTPMKNPYEGFNQAIKNFTPPTGVTPNVFNMYPIPQSQENPKRPTFSEALWRSTGGSDSAAPQFPWNDGNTISYEERMKRMNPTPAPAPQDSAPTAVAPQQPQPVVTQQQNPQPSAPQPASAGWIPSAGEAYDRAKKFLGGLPQAPQPNVLVDTVKSQYPNATVSPDGSVSVPTATVEAQRGWEQYSSNMRALYKASGMSDSDISNKLEKQKSSYFERRNKIAELGGNVRLVPNKDGIGDVVSDIPRQSVQPMTFGRTVDTKNYGTQYNDQLKALSEDTASKMGHRPSRVPTEIEKQYPRLRGETKAAYNERIGRLQVAGVGPKAQLTIAEMEDSRSREQFNKTHELNSATAQQSYALGLINAGISKERADNEAQQIGLNAASVFAKLGLDQFDVRSRVRISQEAARTDSELKLMAERLKDARERMKITSAQANSVAMTYRAFTDSILKVKAALEKNMITQTGSVDAAEINRQMEPLLAEKERMNEYKDFVNRELHRLLNGGDMEQ